MNLPSVTLLIPAYNAAHFIDATLASISAQSQASFRAVISVDVSTDDTLARCATHAARDERFTVIGQEQRLGYAGNCNFLLTKSSSDCAMFAFHDDILAPTCVERLAEALAAMPSAAVAFSDMEMTESTGEKRYWAFTDLDGVTGAVARGRIMLGAPSGWWVPNRGLFRMDAARRVNGVKRHSAGEYACDRPWLFHLSLLGDFVRVPEILCYKFLQKDSLSQTWSNSPEQRLAVQASCAREIWNSDLSVDDKLTLTEALIVHSRPRVSRWAWLPAPIRAAGRSLLPEALLSRLR